MNTCQAIRDYVTANPGQTVKAIAVALGLVQDDVMHLCYRMTTRGMLVRTVRLRFKTFTIGRPVERPVTLDKSLPPDQVMAKRIANRKQLNAKHTAKRKMVREAASLAQRQWAGATDALICVPAAITNEPETVEAWLARGGHVERLVSNWAAPSLGALGQWR